VKLTSRIYGPAPESEVEQIMHQGLFSLDKAKTIKDAMVLLAEEHIHSLAILDESQKPIGILCMNDLIDEIANDIPMDTRLSELKLKAPIFAGLHQRVSEVARIMKRTHEYKVIITDEKGNVQGVVTPEDILKGKNE
jgi:predicted transcriptional regulator